MGKSRHTQNCSNNQLGRVLGFEMAHSGIAKLDGVLHFLSRSFRSAGEQLIHGSLMVEELGLARREEIEKIKTVHQQQGIYDIDFVEMVIRQFCADAFDRVFEKFFEMLIFDALIGSMDRHPRNWGVIRTAAQPIIYRFSPLYDSARALLWDLNDDKVKFLLKNEAELRRYVAKATPRIGLPATVAVNHKCNHFELIEYLMQKHKPVTLKALAKIPPNVVPLAADVLRSWPFNKIFRSVRKRAIIKIIEMRVAQLWAIGKKGGEHGSETVDFAAGI